MRASLGLGSRSSNVLSDISEKMNKNVERRWVKYKFERYRLENVLKRMQNIIFSRLVCGVKLIMCYIKVIAIKKQLFILEMELGKSVPIPEFLRCEKLPISFKYYSCILNLVQSRLSLDRREFFKMKRQMAVIFDEHNTPGYIKFMTHTYIKVARTKDAQKPMEMMMIKL